MYINQSEKNANVEIMKNTVMYSVVHCPLCVELFLY